MITFMFSVLGSVVFWIVYGLIALVFTAWFIKNHTKRTWKYIKTGKVNRYDIHPIWVIFCIFISFPLLIFCLGIMLVLNILDKTLMVGLRMALLKLGECFDKPQQKE